MIPSRAKQTMCTEFQQLLIGFATELDTQTTPTVKQLRQRYQEQVLIFNGPVDDSIATRDLSLTGRDGNSIKLRLFTPPSRVGPLPTCLFIHGGGWVVGDLDTHAGICADIVRQTGGQVMAIDYRLSPETIFPDALHDCIDALRYMVSHADELAIHHDQISLMGDSAGGNLCAALAMAYRGSDINIASQVLIYPGLSADNSLPSFDENEDIPGLSRSDMTYYFQSYTGSAILPDKLSAPLTATDFSSLPKCYISVAEFDPLRDDGIEYAHKLQAAGTPAVVNIEKGLGHSWLWVRNRSAVANHAMRRACEYLK
ncbi:MAG: alpha/beta hydrolase [Granulosicoccaceae bacterium]